MSFTDRAGGPLVLAEMEALQSSHPTRLTNEQAIYMYLMNDGGIKRADARACAKSWAKRVSDWRRWRNEFSLRKP